MSVHRRRRRVPWRHVPTGFFLLCAGATLWTNPYHALLFIIVTFVYLLSIDTLDLRRRVRYLEATLHELVTGEPVDDPR